MPHARTSHAHSKMLFARTSHMCECASFFRNSQFAKRLVIFATHSLQKDCFSDSPVKALYKWCLFQLKKNCFKPYEFEYFFEDWTKMKIPPEIPSPLFRNRWFEIYFLKAKNYLPSITTRSDFHATMINGNGQEFA